MERKGPAQGDEGPHFQSSKSYKGGESRVSVASKGKNKMLEDKRSRVLVVKPNKREKSGCFRCEFQKFVHLGFENSLRTLPPPSQDLTLGNSCSLWPRGQAHHLWEDHLPPPYSSLDSVASQAPHAVMCSFPGQSVLPLEINNEGEKGRYVLLYPLLLYLDAESTGTDRQNSPA